MKAYPGIALALLFLWGGICPAGDPPASAPAEKLSAPVVYADVLLILSSEDGVAAVLFDKDLEQGVSYRYRFLPKGTDPEQTGDGKVFEKVERVPTKGPHGQVVTGVVDKGSQLFIAAGPMKLQWSFAAKGKGWVYYRPEEVRVQIANAKDFEKLDLRRFAR
jgi:hypothetical protein